MPESREILSKITYCSKCVTQFSFTSTHSLSQIIMFPIISLFLFILLYFVCALDTVDYSGKVLKQFYKALCQAQILSIQELLNLYKVFESY